jgi:hypothetical protein
VKEKPEDKAIRDGWVANIRAAWESCTEDQIRQGREWYHVAHQLAYAMSGGDVVAGAGILAAFSPQKAWYLNVRLAKGAFETGEAKGHFQDACRKVERILNGEDPLVVLPKDSKTWSFFRCIVNPNDPEPVVIDRHIWDVINDETNGNKARPITPRRYAQAAHALREAAEQLGELPSVVQAAVWVWKVESIAHLPHRPTQRV